MKETYFLEVFRVGQLIRFIADLNPKATYSRLAFFNFLRHFYGPNDEWQPEMAQHFVSHALVHPYWQKERKTLVAEVSQLLENFAKQFRLEFNLEELQDKTSIQLINIDNYADLCDIVFEYKKREDDQEFRLIALPQSQLLVVSLNSAGRLTVNFFDSLCTIRKGQLEPLRLDLQVSYDQDVELNQDSSHLISLSPHLLGLLQRRENLWQGRYLRGYTFQPCGEFHAQSLAEQPAIYYPLKRIEQYFVDRTSDPFYVTLIQGLERSLNQAQSQSVDPKRFETTLQKAENIAEQVYTEDKYLKLLVKELRQTLQGARSPLKATASGSSSDVQTHSNRARVRDTEL